MTEQRVYQVGQSREEWYAGEWDGICVVCGHDYIHGCKGNCTCLSCNARRQTEVEMNLSFPEDAEVEAVEEGPIKVDLQVGYTDDESKQEEYERRLQERIEQEWPKLKVTYWRENAHLNGYCGVLVYGDLPNLPSENIADDLWDTRADLLSEYCDGDE